MSEAKAVSVREAAYHSLWKCRASGKYSNIEIDAAIKRHSFPDADRALFTNLVYGTIERGITLDHILAQFSSLPLEEIDPRILIILELGLYQCYFLDRIPDHAAVNECCELAKKFAKAGSVNFVNAILRRAIREKESVHYPDKKSDPISYLSVKYSFPTWLCEMWSSMYGAETAEALLAGASKNPPITIRTNTLLCSREALAEKLAAAEITAVPTPNAPHGLILTGRASFDQLNEIAPGAFFVQDEASQLAVETLSARPGEFIIDTCCCPGGKSFGCALNMQNSGSIFSCDLHANKLSLVEKGASRLGISIIETRAADGSKRDDSLFNKADRVICDVPCSGLGVIAKKPEIRYKSPEDIARLPEVQYKILDNVSGYVKQGGVLLYSTCTLNKAENEDVVNRFLAAHGEFTLDSMRTYFPHIDGCDGFFTAKLIKA